MALIALENRGIDPAPLLYRAEISQAKLMNPIGRVQIKKEMLFWQLAVEKTADPQLGLHLADDVPFGTYPLMEYIGASCQSLHQALVFFSKYAQIVYGGWHPILTHEKELIRFSLGTEGNAESFRQTDEFALALMIKRLKHYSGVDVPLQSVSFRHAFSGNLEDYIRIFQTEVLFGQADTSLLFERSILSIPCKRSDHFLLGSLLNLAEKFLLKLPADAPFKQSELVKQIILMIRKDLALGEPLIDKMASTLAMSARTLQRKLEDEGTSLSQILSGVRKEMATELLKNKSLSFEEVALSLGYSTSSAFNRAFKQWFKLSPSEYRRLHVN